VVVFRSLACEQLRRILDLGLQQVQRRVDEGLSTPFRIIVTEMAAEFLLKEGVDTSQLMAKGVITLKNGRVEQKNFDGYALPYIMDAPVAIDVHIVKSTEAPTGCGEAPVPVIAPAVVNALTRWTGKRYRTLPLVSI
jgi:hypothetical protein